MGNSPLVGWLRRTLGDLFRRLARDPGADPVSLPIERAIRICGLSRLARKLGVSRQAVDNWRHRRVPPEYCIRIELATGGQVTRHELRPDIFGPPSDRGARKRAA